MTVYDPQYPPARASRLGVVVWVAAGGGADVLGLLIWRAWYEAGLPSNFASAITLLYAAAIIWVAEAQHRAYRNALIIGSVGLVGAIWALAVCLLAVWSGG